MTDEIDIEEHDVMDNPMIRRIFPDLSVIKKEISKYYDEGPDTKPEPVLKPLISQTDLAPVIPCDTKQFSTNSYYADVPDSPKDNSRIMRSNVIILGSKPNKLCTEKFKQHSMLDCEPKVTLRDISLYLNKSRTYCKDCTVLFPNNREFEAHKKSIHDHRNQTFTGTNRKGINKSKAVKKYQCYICISVLSTKGNLTKHLKNIHQITYDSNKTKNNIDDKAKSHKTMNNKENSDDDSVSLDDEKTANVLKAGANCFHCHKVFPTQKALVDHLYEILEPKGIDCKKCKMKFSNLENLQKHMASIHNDSDAASTSYECYKCAIKFVSKAKLDLHNQNKHKTVKPKLRKTGNALDKLPISYESENEILTEEEGENVILPKRMRNVSANIEFTQDDDKPLALSKRLRSTAIKNSNAPEGIKDHKLKHKIDSKLSNTQHIITSETQRINVNSKKEKCSVASKSSNIYDKKAVEKAYECSICSYYILTFKNYGRHMARNHKVKKVSKVKKVLFNSQCKFCMTTLANVNLYNKHIIRSHEDKTKLKTQTVTKEVSRIAPNMKALNTNGDNKSFVFKSLLYKCMKCDVYFLTAKSAMNHLEHMEVLINWKCGICNRIFKGIDKLLHDKQHLYCNSFTVYNILCESDFKQILYLCLKCTIHFNEDSYVRHHSTCGVVASDSVYCKVCDCLIGKLDSNSHDQIHAKNKNMNASDFTIVETDLIIINDSGLNHTESKNDTLCSIENSSKKKIYDKSRLYLALCNTCQCLISYVSSIGVSAASRKVHMEARCRHVKKQPCKICGIVISAQTVKVHRKLHNEVKDLSIQNFSFFDLVTQKPVRPPIPVYPSCNICRVQFLSRTDVIEHECDGYNYLVCHLCQTKLSEVAFKFHMQFHEYSMVGSKELPATPQVQPKTNTNMLNTTTTCSLRRKKEFVMTELLYSCIICKITFDAYDPVIKHCQSHYDRRKAPVTKQTCQFCALHFDERYCGVHQEMHLSKKINVKSIKMINFDPFYFCFDNNVWVKHIFASLTGDEVEKNLSNSIYRFECRLKMEIFQSGPSNVTLYECEKCLIFVDPDSLYEHAAKLQCTTLEKYPCIACGLCFDSVKYKIAHEKLHTNSDISMKSWRLVRTNKNKDQIFHNMMFTSRNQFIMYQCRNCLVSVDKAQRDSHRCAFSNIVKCSHCGLLFSNQDYNNIHHNRHKEFQQFNTNHISVVFFGKKLYKGKQIISPSFTGKIFDFTFYKCPTCELCIKNKDSTYKHKCVFDDSKYKCRTCNLYFLRQELLSHSVLHETNTEFEVNNLNIIIFAVKDNFKAENHIVCNKENSSLQNSDSKINKLDGDAPQSDTITPERLESYVKLFKCDCGLHFIDKLNARKHYNDCNPNMKISKQLCSKCELLFTPAELFTHLLTHHGDKHQEYKFDISFFDKDDKKTPLYKCNNCNLHFVHESEVNDHFDKCDKSGIGGEVCQKCGLRFKLSSLYKNKHRSLCEKRYEINVVSEVKDIETSTKDRIDDTNGVIDSIVTKQDIVLSNEYSLKKDYLSTIDLSKYTNVIYKCDVCDAYYITQSTWRRHVHFLTLYDVCNICGLNFSLQSLARHKYIHHEKFNLKKDEFVIKNSNL